MSPTVQSILQALFIAVFAGLFKAYSDKLIGALNIDYDKHLKIIKKILFVLIRTAPYSVLLYAISSTVIDESLATKLFVFKIVLYFFSLLLISVADMFFYFYRRMYYSFEFSKSIGEALEAIHENHNLKHKHVYGLVTKMIENKRDAPDKD